LPEARTRVVYVCSFLSDEPVEEMLGAAARLGEDFRVFVTGRVTKEFESLARSAPPSVTFTGFIPEEEYVSLLSAADVVVALTKRENTLLCGAYEGVSLRKPLVLSNQAVLRSYFKKGVVLTENSPDSLEAAIRKAARERDRLGAELAELVPELKADWASRFERLKARLGLADAA
jgi:glycosyltransferase involved in cell wall biosynthesis